MTVKHEGTAVRARHSLSIDPCSRQLPRLQRQSAPAHEVAADTAFAH